MSAIRSLTPARAAPRDRRNPDLRQRRHYHEWGAERQAAHPANNFGNVAAQTISITGVAYNLASSNTIAPLNFGVLHVGDLTATPMPTITNTAPPGVL